MRPADVGYLMKDRNAAEELTLLDVIRILRPKIRLICLIGILAAVAAGVFVKLCVPPRYSSYISMYVYASDRTESAGSVSSGELAAAESLAVTYREILQSHRVLSSVCGYLEDGRYPEVLTPEELAELIEISVIDDTQLLRIQARTTQPDFSAAIANAFETVGSEEILRVTKAGGVEIVDHARVPTEPDGPGALKVSVLAMVAGVLASCGWIILRGILNGAVYGEEDIAKYLDVPLMGQIPEDGRSETFGPARLRVFNKKNSGGVKEAYELLRTNLMMTGNRNPCCVIQVTSPNPGEGKSMTAADLAVCFAILGKKTLLMDCDLRNPIQKKLWNIPNGDGMSDLLNSLDKAVLHQIGSRPFFVLCGGNSVSNSAELLASGRFREVLGYLKSRYDCIIMDSPPVNPVADGQILAQYADCVLVTAAYGKTTLKDLKRSIQRLKQVSNGTCGVVIYGIPGKKSCRERMENPIQKMTARV